MFTLPVIGILTLGFFFYSFQAWVSYDIRIKSLHPSIYYSLGLALSTITAVTWLRLARDTHDTQVLYVYAIVWDLLLVAAFYFVPILFFGVKLSPLALVGLLLIVAGTVMVKVYS